MILPVLANGSIAGERRTRDTECDIHEPPRVCERAEEEQSRSYADGQ